VLERFFGLYASINSFTELVITRASQPGREWKRWLPRAGYQQIL
jgi:type VI secretion system protein ImpG